MDLFSTAMLFSLEKTLHPHRLSLFTQVDECIPGRGLPYKGVGGDHCTFLALVKIRGLEPLRVLKSKMTSLKIVAYRLVPHFLD